VLRSSRDQVTSPSKHFPTRLGITVPGVITQKNVILATPAVNSEAYKNFSVSGY
jgi:hypothetical protein